MAREKVIGPGPADDEHKKVDAALRPKFLREVIGQKRVADRLQIAVDASRKLKEPLGHILFLRHERPDLIASLSADAGAEAARLRSELDRLQLAEALHQRRQLIRRLLAEHRLPDPELCGAQAGSLVSAAFVNQLLEARDEAAMRELVAERARLVTDALRWDGASAKPMRPQSREQALSEAAPIDIDAATFARAIS